MKKKKKKEKQIELQGWLLSSQHLRSQGQGIGCFVFEKMLARLVDED